MPNQALQRTAPSVVEPGIVRHCSHIVKLQRLTFLCLTLLVAASAQARLPVVSDPLAAYFRNLVSEHTESGVSVVEADFDCDGRIDVAITTMPQGHAGADWTIYLRRADGRFTQLGSVTTKANRFHLTRQKNGSSRLAVMQRAGPGELVITYYDISQVALRKLREEDVHIPEEQTGRNRIDEVFGAGYSELPATDFTFAQLQARFSK